jgi:hypothetical protein
MGALDLLLTATLYGRQKTPEFQGSGDHFFAIWSERLTGDPIVLLTHY